MNDITILHQNLQCLSNKINEVEVFLDEEFCHFLCVSEHWIPHNNIETIKISGFNLVNHFSRSKFIHGGVAVFVNDILSNDSTFKCDEVHDINRLSVEMHFECAAIKFCYLDFRVILMTVYRSCQGAINIFIKKLEEALYITARFKQFKLIICGDFNINFLKNSNELNLLNDLMETYNISATIQEPTRLQNCIDNICVSNTFPSYRTKVMFNGMSDHSA